MPTLNTYLTEQGYETLMTEGLTSSIAFYNLVDHSHIYTVDAKESFVLPITGSHVQITKSQCAFANYDGVFMTKPTTEEIRNRTSKVQLNFVNQDCDYTFNQPDINLNINLHSWIYQLQNLTYNLNMPGFKKKLWDYLTATIQTLNLTTNTYENTMYTADLGISWVPKTQEDIMNMSRLSPTYVHVQGSQKMLVDERGRYPNSSPFFLAFSSNEVNGVTINNTASNIILVVDEMGYWVNEREFMKTSVVERSDLSQYKSVKPAARVGRNIYYLKDRLAYPTTEGFVGYAMNMIKTDGSGETLVTGLINQIILFAKTYFKPENNIYTMPINLRTVITNKNTNFITRKDGGDVTLNFRYDPSNINNVEDIIELI